MNDADVEIVSRRVQVLAGAALVALVLAISAFIALRGLPGPLWLARHAAHSITP